MFLLGHWKKIAMVMILAGVWFHGDRNGAGRVQARWDAETARIAEKSAAIAAENAEKDRLNAEATRNLEADYAKKLQAANAGRDAFAERLRNVQARCNRVAPVAPVDTSGPAGGSTGGDSGSGGLDIESAQRLRAVGLKLQETVKLCVAWANENGR